MDSEVERVSSWRDPSVRALFIASTLMWTCNSMYLINMPSTSPASWGWRRSWPVC